MTVGLRGVACNIFNFKKANKMVLAFGLFNPHS
jgi:hypothetical protein